MKHFNKAPYRGLWLLLLAMIGPAVAITFIFNYLLGEYQPQFGRELNFAAAIASGFGVNALMHLIYFISGVFGKAAHIVIRRLKEFFKTVTATPRMAVKLWWDDVLANGILFWICSGVIAANLWVAIDALQRFIEMYTQM